MRVAVLAACLVLAGCGQDGPRPLTGAEAQRLATVRLANHADGGAAFTTTVDGTMPVKGWIDWRRRLLYLSAAGSRPVLIQATPYGIATLETAATGTPPLPPPPGKWVARPLMIKPPASGFDTLAAVLLALSADRPENPQLLRQQGAAWLGSDNSLDVFRGPGVGKDAAAGGKTRYWLDGRSRLHRLELNPTSGPRVTIEFERSPLPQIPVVAALRESGAVDG